MIVVTRSIITTRWIIALAVVGWILRTGCCWRPSSSFFFFHARRFPLRTKAQCCRRDRTQPDTYYCARPSSSSLSSLRSVVLAAEELPAGDVLEYETLEPGILPGHRIVQEYSLDHYQRHGFGAALNELAARGVVSNEDIRRLYLTGANVTVPVALMILDPTSYPSLSRARKACRKRSIVLVVRECQDKEETTSNTSRALGLVGDRVVPAQHLALQIQQRFGTGYFAANSPSDKHDPDVSPIPPLHVLYEDDHVAIVHKPAGLLVYRAPQSSPSCPTTRAMLPRCLVPPVRGTMGALSRPVPVHRLDKPTSGCLVVAKTKPALVALGRSFHDRTVRKTYTALVSGKLHTNHSHSDVWNVIDEPLEGKEAVTYWRVVSESLSAFALDETLSLVELKPKTGRFHQLRRHMALIMGKPLVGDDDYDGNSPNARRLRHRGLCLCATSITLPHPWYNTPQGRHEYLRRQLLSGVDPDPRESSGELGYLWLDEGEESGVADGTVMITARVPVPAKFHSLISHEHERFLKFHAHTSPATSSEQSHS